ncbi:MAG: hypothetical protein JXQ83_02880 [Candidatus Glassbacteria bacterium]|nr:hypothetical protein [Candidatus Glassbacteria bacterium]
MTEEKEAGGQKAAAVIKKRFGEYLVEKGLITEDQLDDALAIQHAINRRLGTIATMDDIITVAELYDILDRQHMLGSPFGETAKLLHLITDRQLTDLLKRQQREKMKVGEILVGLLYLQKLEMEAALDQFFKEQRNGKK